MSSEEDEVLELEQYKPVVNKNRGPRASVSAEAFGSWNKKEDFKAPYYPKTAEQKEALKLRLDQAFMFNHLNPSEFDIVLGAMVKSEKKAGETVITQGDDGECLYVVESGTLNCSKVFVSALM